MRRERVIHEEVACAEKFASQEIALRVAPSGSEMILPSSIRNRRRMNNAPALQ